MPDKLLRETFAISNAPLPSFEFPGSSFLTVTLRLAGAKFSSRSSRTSPARNVPMEMVHQLQSIRSRYCCQPMHIRDIDAIITAETELAINEFQKTGRLTAMNRVGTTGNISFFPFRKNCFHPFQFDKFLIAARPAASRNRDSCKY